MDVLADAIDTIIQIYIFLLIAMAVISWLTALNVINTRNRAVYVAMNFLYRITEPVLRPIRRLVPSMGGIDVSPVILILVLHFVGQRLLVDYLRSLA
jgi:YggT family protein